MKGCFPAHGKVIPGSWIRSKHGHCECTRKTTLLFDVDYPLDTVYTHKGCVCNEQVALTHRHQRDDGCRFDSEVLPSLRRVWMRWVPQCSPLTIPEVVAKYSGRKRKIAEAAAKDLEQWPLIQRDAKLKMFLKDDKYTAVQPKAPRCIQYRNKRYALNLAKYTYPIEAALFNRTNRHGIYWSSKKLDSLACAANLRRAWDRFAEPIALLLDHSAFDAHWSRQLQQLATLFNSECYRQAGKHGTVRMLMGWQNLNSGRTKHGTRYATPYTRMSGDQNTGLDNTKGNHSMICWALETAGILDYEVIVDGDDSVVVFSRADQALADGLPDLFAKLGQATKIEWAEEFEHIEFCQKRPVYTHVGWRMCRNPVRILTRMRWTVKNITTRTRLPYIKAICQAESAVNQHVPVMGPLSATWARSLRTRRYRGPLDQDWLLKLHGASRLTTYDSHVSYESRISFERAWGISIPEQLHLEALTMQLHDLNVDETFALGLGLSPQ